MRFIIFVNKSCTKVLVHLFSLYLFFGFFVFFLFFILIYWPILSLFELTKTTIIRGWVSSFGERNRSNRCTTRSVIIYSSRFFTKFTAKWSHRKPASFLQIVLLNVYPLEHFNRTSLDRSRCLLNERHFRWSQ